MTGAEPHGAALAEAVARQAAGDFAGAVDRYREALRGALPAAIEQGIWHNLAAAMRKLGRLDEAEAAFVRALALDGSDADAWHGLGLVNAERGEPEVAVLAHRQALALVPSAAGFVHLGNALRSAADRAAAADAFRAAIDLDPAMAAAHYNLHAAIYEEDAPFPALAALDRALALSPDHVFARFFRHALGRWHGAPGELTLPAEASFLGESLDFILAQRRRETRMFADTFETLRHAARLAGPGVVVELGVRRGTSLRFLADRFPARRIHGFDSFQGLPEPWGDQPTGLYSTEGRLPAAPENVVLHPGWFADTLPSFAASLDDPIAFLHVDCDLYASTRCALDALAPLLTRGAVIVFDDYLCNPGWDTEEHLAFIETARDHHWAFRYAAFSLFSRQAVASLT